MMALCCDTMMCDIMTHRKNIKTVMGNNPDIISITLIEEQKKVWQNTIIVLLTFNL